MENLASSGATAIKCVFSERLFSFFFSQASSLFLCCNYIPTSLAKGKTSFSFFFDYYGPLGSDPCRVWCKHPQTSELFFRFFTIVISHDIVFFLRIFLDFHFSSVLHSKFNLECMIGLCRTHPSLKN